MTFNPKNNEPMTGLRQNIKLKHKHEKCKDNGIKTDGASTREEKPKAESKKGKLETQAFRGPTEGKLK